MDKTMEEVENSLQNQCRIGNLERVMELIENGADPTIIDDDERSVLHWAASSQNPELVSYILSLGKINIDARDEFKTTPLMCAVSSGRLENTKLLIEAGANVNLEDENEETVLLMTKGNADILKLFIHLIQNINKQNGYGVTALMKAASLGNTEIVSLLLDHGADMSIQDGEGNTAGHYAAFENRRDAYVLMLHRGYDENIKNKEGKVVLDYVK